MVVKREILIIFSLLTKTKIQPTLNVTGLEKIVKQLIDNGADINGTNQFNNNSALILAIQACFEKTAELLVQNGANVNIVGDYGNTALILAAENGKQIDFNMQ